MNPAECRRRLASTDHAYLATVRPDGAPHLVPVVLELTEDEITLAVDHKPKRDAWLQRLVNIREEPRVCVLADRYSASWDELWWVRADGTAVVVEDGPEHRLAVERLCRRHAQYRRTPPTGPAVVITVERWSGWAAR
jgi:PPOX class probable F420-dependent enzyme